MRVLTTLAALALLVAPLEAQDGRHTRRGFWFGAGVGAGSTGSHCDTCYLDGRAPGVAGYLKLGTSLSRKFLLGGEISGWAISDVFGVDQAMGIAQITLHWYPARNRGFFLKAGAGAMGYRWDNGISDTRDEGAAFHLGLGYDLRLADNFSVVPFLNAYGASDLKRKINGVSTQVPTTISRDMVQVGLGLTFH